jgi:hypothetical protein
MLDVLIPMRLPALLIAAILTAAPVAAQHAGPSPAAAQPSTAQDGAKTSAPDLPVSLDKIKGALSQPAPPLRGLNEVPNFRVSVEENQRVKLEDLVNSLDFKAGPAPPGGLYGFEQQRQMFPAADNPLRQPYSEFSQPELLTILVENLAGRYLAGRAASAITSAERARAEAQARAEVTRAVIDYCAAQPHGGAGIQICPNPGVSR